MDFAEQGSPNEESPLLQCKKPMVSAPLRVLIVTCIAAVAEGYDIGIINGLVVRVEEAFELSTVEVAVLVGLPQFAAAFSSLCSGSLADHYCGRKLTVALAMSLIMIGSVVMAVSMNFTILLLGRLVIFLGVGLAISTVTTYLAEVAPASKRGLYGSQQDFCINAGVLMSAIAASALVGLKNDWRIMAGVGAILPLIAAITLITDFVPESPRYMMMQGKTDVAEQLLLELTGDNREEVADTLEAWKEENNNLEAFTWPQALQAFRTTHSRAALAGIGTAVMSFACCQFATVSVFSTYILKHYSGMEDQEALQMSVIIGAVKFVVISFACFYAMDALGRRPLMLVTCICGAVVFLMMAVSVQTAVPGTLMVLCLCLLATSFSLGIGPVQYAYVSEVYETKLRAKGTAISFCLSRLTNGFVCFIVPIALKAETPGLSFFAMALMNVLCTAFVYQFCLETKQRTLEQLKLSFSDPAYSDLETCPLSSKQR